jgi:hypothetical protein
MRLLRTRFLKLFWIFCALVALFTTVENLWKDNSELRSSLKQTVHTDFDTRYRLRCAQLMSGKSQAEINAACDPQNPTNAPRELESYQKLEAEFQQYVSEIKPNALLLSIIVAENIGIFFLAIPLTIALLISFNATLWILSKITRSKLRLFFLIVVDVLVATIMPPLLTSIFLLLVVGAAIILFGQIIAFASFSSANWFTLTLGAASLGMHVKFIFPAAFFLLAVILPGKLGWAVAALTLVVGGIWMATDRVSEFISDAAKLFQLDFTTDSLQATIDWAIFTDLLFSAFYLVPCLLLVLANRSETTRTKFLNLVMWVGDHSRGPFIALAELSTLLFSLLRPR